jgi:putative salt-induced outer membrane protein
MKHLICLAAVLFLPMVIAVPLYAQEEPPWKGNLEFSYVETSGNTSSETFVVAGKAERTFSASKWSAEIKALYGKKEEITSDKSWMGTLKYDRNITERTYGFLSETVERNTLKGIEVRYTSLAGLGYYFVKTPTDVLKGEAGLGYTRENPIAPLNDRGYPTARLFGGYSHSFTEKTRFEQTVEYLPNLKEGDDYLINEESAFITNLMGNLAFKISYAVFYDNEPPAGFGKYDRLFKTALLYTF